MIGSKPRTASLAYPRSKDAVNSVNVRTHILDVNGFDWKVETVETLEMNDDDMETWIAIRFENLMSAEASLWYCEATLSYTILHADARKSLAWSQTVRLTPQRNAYTKTIAIREDFMDDKGFWNEANDCEIIISIEPHGEKGHKFYKRTIIDWSQNLENADCCIQVEDQKFFVGKATLVRHSKYFDSVFFGSDGVDMTPFMLTDASKHDFRLFLNYIHRCDSAKISAETVLLFIQIAVRLQSEGILAKAENFIVKNSDQFHLSMKIDLSETYQLPGLKDHCSHLLANSCLDEINNIMATAHYPAVWSDEIRNNTVKRLQQIANEQQQQIRSFMNGFNPFHQQSFGPSPSLFAPHVPQNPYNNPPPPAPRQRNNHLANLMGHSNPPPPPRPAPAPRQRRAPVRRRAPPAVPPPQQQQQQQNLLAPAQNNWQPSIIQPQQLPANPPVFQPQPALFQPHQPPVLQPQLAQILAQPPAPAPLPVPVPAPKRRRVNNRAAAQQP